MYKFFRFAAFTPIGEFERELIKERSTEGRIKAIARGVKFGARPKLKKQEIQDLIRDFCDFSGPFPHLVFTTIPPGRAL